MILASARLAAPGWPAWQKAPVSHVDVVSLTCYLHQFNSCLHLFSHENESNLILLTLQDHLKCNIRCLEKPGVLISGSADEPAQKFWVDWLPLQNHPKPSCQEEQKTRSETIRKPQSCSSYFIIFHCHQTMDLKSQNIQKSDAKVVAAKLTATIPPTQTQVSCIRSFFIPVKSHELCEHVMTLCCARPIEP